MGNDITEAMSELSAIMAIAEKLKPKCQHRYMAQTKDGPFSPCMKCGNEGKVDPFKFVEALNDYTGSYPAYVDYVEDEPHVEASVPVGYGKSF